MRRDYEYTSISSVESKLRTSMHTYNRHMRWLPVHYILANKIIWIEITVDIGGVERVS
jgi:hypothetical protein